MACEPNKIKARQKYMKKKLKKTISMICAGGLAVICLAGCGKGTADSPKIPTQEIQQNNVVDGAQTNNNAADDGEQANNNAADDGASNSMGNGGMFDGANLEGSVVEFSDEGFSLSPATTKEEGGGMLSAEAAPGSENDENNIQITYTDNTVFQIVNLSRSSQSEVSREDADKESVKKQSSVCVFGSCQDSHHWTADKILILKWQE